VIDSVATVDVALPHGITLSCRVSGPEDAPVLMFLHGFPEAAFVWDELLMHFGDRYRCIAPNLRGYERSSAPAGVEPYRAKHLVADIAALVDLYGGRLKALVAHDWGGAVAWNFAVQHEAKLDRLVIINSPHPATFLRALQTDPAQQAASAYMVTLRGADAESLLAADDYAWLWARFQGGWGGRADWMTEAVKAQYREVWRQGLTGPLNYYRASPLYPPTADDPSVMALNFPAAFVTVHVPTLVLWAEEDKALLPCLLDGLDRFVPQLKLVRLPGATHWVVHEQPQRIAQEIEVALAA